MQEGSLFIPTYPQGDCCKANSVLEMLRDCGSKVWSGVRPGTWNCPTYPANRRTTSSHACYPDFSLYAFLSSMFMRKQNIPLHPLGFDSPGWISGIHMQPVTMHPISSIAVFLMQTLSEETHVLHPPYQHTNKWSVLPSSPLQSAAEPRKVTQVPLTIPPAGPCHIGTPKHGRCL